MTSFKGLIKGLIKLAAWTLSFNHMQMLFIYKCFFQEENDVGDFLLSLDKDPQQEDFLQGHMLGNPYNGNEPGLGPLMRDVKNKICGGRKWCYL